MFWNWEVWSGAMEEVEMSSYPGFYHLPVTGTARREREREAIPTLLHCSALSHFQFTTLLSVEMQWIRVEWDLTWIAKDI